MWRQINSCVCFEMAASNVGFITVLWVLWSVCVFSLPTQLYFVILFKSGYCFFFLMLWIFTLTVTRKELSSEVMTTDLAYKYNTHALCGDFYLIYHQLSPSSHSQHLKISFYFLFPSFPGSSPSSRPFQFLREDLFGHPNLLHSL